MNDVVKLDMMVEEKSLTAQTKVQESKAVAQIQACMIMAKRDPRNENQAYANIMEACKRISLADQATYNYPRGGKMVTGASIRLAEVLARNYGNIHIEITIVNQTRDQTEAVATAIDMQTNYVVSQGFVVPHQRSTKKGLQILTDERDIREMVQNIGSRILRGCILRVIPPDITEDALAQCKKTQESSDVPISEQIKKMIMAFDDLGVKVEHLQKRLGHNLDATIASEIVVLKGIYKSIKDGMADREDFFEISIAEKANDAKDELNNILAKKKEVVKDEKKADKKDS
jgi:hypothetical protein